MFLFGARALCLLHVAVSVSASPIQNGQYSSSITVEPDGVHSRKGKPLPSTMIRRGVDSHDASSVVDEAGELSDQDSRDIDLEMMQHKERKGHGTDFASEYAMREPRSNAEDTLLHDEAKASLLDALVWQEDLADGRNPDRTPQGCLAGKEELYGSRCYKKCSKFSFDAPGTGNAGYDERVAPNSCRKDVCNEVTEDNFGNNCFKICADLVAAFPIRKSLSKCRNAAGTVSESNAYNVGYGDGGQPRRILDVAGDDCPDTVDCCKGYNVNDDPAEQTQCPYIPTQMGSCVETLRGIRDVGYRGCQIHTRSGRTCQNWNSQSPHAHSNTPSAKPGKGLGNHNKCRNPDNDQTIWCYTTDSNRRWELCNPL